MIIRKKIIILVFIALAVEGGILLFNKKNAEIEKTEEVRVDDFVNQTFVDNREGDRIASSTPGAASHDDGLGKKNTDNKILSAQFSCTASKANDFDCYQDYYKGIVNQEGIKEAFSDLRARYDTNGYIKSQCHPITHVIGNEAAKKFEDVAEAYAQADSFCWSGYHHGVLEGIIGRIGQSKLESQLDNICKPLAERERYSFDHYNCVHGLGHGVMAINDDDLFIALKKCDLVTDSWERTSCWSGAFMENVIIDNKYHYSRFLKPEDPLYPCNAVGEDYKSTCYLMQTSYMLKVTNGDFTKVFELCGSIEENHRNTCYTSLGRDISGRSVSNVVQTKQNCALGKTHDQRMYCIIGAVKDFISYLHSDVRAKELCSVLDEEDIKSVCYQTTESYYASFK